MFGEVFTASNSLLPRQTKRESNNTTSPVVGLIIFRFRSLVERSLAGKNEIFTYLPM
jgi:hypothetical protein